MNASFNRVRTKFQLGIWSTLIEKSLSNLPNKLYLKFSMLKLDDSNDMKIFMIELELDS